MNDDEIKTWVKAWMDEHTNDSPTDLDKALNALTLFVQTEPDLRNRIHCEFIRTANSEQCNSVGLLTC